MQAYIVLKYCFKVVLGFLLLVTAENPPLEEFAELAYGVFISTYGTCRNVGKSSFLS
jgi:hypothetical protein